MTPPQPLKQSLVELGLTDMEAEIYIYLLRHSPATGYKAAKGIGRSFTNTYKSLEALQAKGAILTDDGSAKLYRAVPVEELMDQLETRFREHRREAVRAARLLPDLFVDTRIYQLTSVDQVYERCRRMLAEARERVLMELFPGPLEILREPVEAAAARGVNVTARVYEPAALEGVRLVRSPYGQETLNSMKSDWLSVYVDGRQYLLGLLSQSGDVVYQAVWSANPVLARTFFDSANSDLHHYAFRPLLDTATSVDELRAAYAELQEQFPVGGDLGFRDLMERIDRDWRDPDPPAVEE